MIEHSALATPELGYRRSGAIIVSAEASELDAAEHLLRERLTHSPDMGKIGRLNPRDAQSLFPPLRSDYAALHIAGGARVDGRRFTTALLTAAQNFGAQLIGGEAQLIVNNNRVTGVAISGKMFDADQVIVAGGAWTASIVRILGLELPITPQRGQIVHLRLPQTNTSDWPVVLPAGSHYLVSFEDSRIVIGATRESGCGFDYRVTAGGQADVLTAGLTVAPGLTNAEILETRVGFRPIGPNLRPLLGRPTGIEGLIIGTGLGAAGLTIGPLAGLLLAETILGKSPSLDLVPFDPVRPFASHENDLMDLR